MSSRKYERLKKELELSVERSDRHKFLLATLKEIFKDKINSPRRSELITTISYLIKVLEIRNVLSEDNVDILKDIARILPNKVDLINKILLYQEFYSDYNNIDNSGSIAHNITQLSSENITTNQTINSNISNIKLNRIKETIINEIGSFWRDLARNLEIREIDIVEAEYHGNSIVDKAKFILEKYDNIKDPQRWFLDLCEALERSRRKDLSKSIQKIMAMDI